MHNMTMIGKDITAKINLYLYRGAFGSGDPGLIGNPKTNFEAITTSHIKKTNNGINSFPIRIPNSTHSTTRQAV